LSLEFLINSSGAALELLQDGQVIGSPISIGLNVQALTTVFQDFQHLAADLAALSQTQQAGGIAPTNTIPTIGGMAGVTTPQPTLQQVVGTNGGHATA
jgi:hypothetical protein